VDHWFRNQEPREIATPVRPSFSFRTHACSLWAVEHIASGMMSTGIYARLGAERVSEGAHSPPKGNTVPEDELTFPDAVRKSLDSLNHLAKRVKDWQADQPKRDLVAKLRFRAEERLSEWHRYPFLSANKRLQRVNAAYKSRQAEYNEKVWQATGSFNDEVRTTFEGLSAVLGPDEVDRLIAEIIWSNIDSIAKTVQLTIRRVEQFLVANVPAAAPDKVPITSSFVVSDSAEGRKTKRAQSLADARKRWGQVNGKEVAFSWIHQAARVDHKDAYKWKVGELPDSSTMSQSIERVLLEPSPPSKAHRTKHH
jgi:hypothetical protein